MRTLLLALLLLPGPAQTLFEKGRQQLAAGDAEGARRSFEAAVAADPKFAEAYVLLARVAQDARDWNGLIEISERLLKVNSVDFPIGYVSLAVGHYQLGDKPAAEKSLRAAQQIDPERRFPQSWQLLGVILFERGDYAGAAEQWKEFLKSVPPDSVSPEFRARVADAEARAGAIAAESAGPTFRTDTELALVRFQVSPKRGRFLTDLRPEDIEILEDGVPQKIALFEGGRYYPRKAPIEISLLFDASGSVRAAGTLDPHVFQQSLLDEYENASIAIYAFSDKMVRLTGPSRHPQVLKKAMDGVLLVPPGSTPLFESITATVRSAAARPGAVRMLVVFSDGESTKPGDMDQEQQAIQAAKEAGVSVYPVLLRRSTAIGNPDASVSGFDPYRTSSGPSNLPGSLNTELSVQRFSRLADETGGEATPAVAGSDVIARILQSMARRVQYDYVADYPTSSVGKKRHEVEVALKAKDRGTVLGGKRIVLH